MNDDAVPGTRRTPPPAEPRPLGQSAPSPHAAAPAPPAPPVLGRVRVVAPRSQASAVVSEASVSQEVAEQSAVGEVMVRSLIRSQLRLGLVVSSGFVAALLICWVAVRWVPAFAQWRILGVPAPWLMLGMGVYPIIGACAWLYVRAANRNEDRYRDLVDGR